MAIVWTGNDSVWFAIRGDQWAMIQEIEESDYPFLVYVGHLMDDDGGETKIDTTCWHTAGKFKTLDLAQAWAEQKLE